MPDIPKILDYLTIENAMILLVLEDFWHLDDIWVEVCCIANSILRKETSSRHGIAIPPPAGRRLRPRDRDHVRGGTLVQSFQTTRFRSFIRSWEGDMLSLSLSISISLSLHFSGCSGVIKGGGI